MIEALIIAVMALVLIVVVDLSVTLEVVALAVFVIFAIISNEIYRRKLRKAEETERFLRTQIFLINQQLFGMTGNCPIEKMKISMTDTNNNDNDEN